MDSGNSGSMQSSSTGGGDEEYDSRVVDHSSISAFLNNNTTPLSQQPRHHVDHVIPFTNNNVSSSNHHQHSMLDPLSNYQLDHPNPIQRSLLNNMVWSSKAASRSDLEGLISSSQNQQQQLPFDLSSQLPGQAKGAAAFSMPPPETASSRGGLVLSDHDQVHHNNNNNNNMVRNPKKRSRASRRAPTTVLTTDTTNFRAMVQEFTGIPAPPFTSSSPFTRTRLDLFGNSSSSSPSQQPSYLLRPFAQKLIHPFPPSTNNLSTTNSTSINYQQHPLNMMMNNNQILSFQSILQNTKYPLENSNLLAASKTTQPSSLEIPNTVVDNSHLKMTVLEELGLSHVNTGYHHHHNMVSSSSSGATLSRVINNNNNNMGNPNSSVDWVQRTGSTLSNNNDGDDDHGGVSRSLSGTTANYNNNNVHGEKGPDCGVAARSEGMVESWINCSSD